MPTTKQVPTWERLRDIVLEVRGLPPGDPMATITPDQEIAHFASIDSLDAIEIVLRVELEFDVDLNDSVFLESKTLNEAVAMIVKAQQL